MDTPEASFRATVKIRYNSTAKLATVYPEKTGPRVEFDEPQLAITSGQLAVFYVDRGPMRRVAGAGWIEEAQH
jgi:tRNA U34 2-thiouridine synthase MnmA/TrmU